MTAPGAIFVPMYVFVYICICIYMYTYTRVCMHELYNTCTDIHDRAEFHRPTYVCLCIYICVYIYMYMYIRVIHIDRSTYVCKCIPIFPICIPIFITAPGPIVVSIYVYICTYVCV